MVEYLLEPLTGLYLGIGGLLVGILGIILAFVFYLSSKIISIPKYTLENDNLLDLNSGFFPQDMHISFDNHQIRTLNKTVMKFWNAGKKTIDQNDLVPEHLQIDFGTNDDLPIIFLSIEVDKVIRESTTVNAEIFENRYIKFNFNYLDYGDGFVITIIHTGKYFPVKVSGNIKGVHKGIQNVTETNMDRMLKIENVIMTQSLGNVLELYTNIIWNALRKK